MLLSAYLLSIAVAMGLFEMPPLFPTLGSLWGIGAETLGMLQTIFGIGGLLMALPAAFFILPRLGPKRLGLLCGILMTAGSAVTAISNSFELVLIGRFIEGCAFGACMLFPIELITKWFPQGERGKAIGIWAPFAPVAALIIFLAGPQLLQFGWTSIPWAVTIFAALCTLFFLIAIKPEEKGAAPASALNLWKAIRNRNLWLVGITWLVYNYFLVSLTSFTPTYFERLMGTPIELASAVAIVPVAMQIWCAPIWGAISDRLRSLKKIIVVGGCVSFVWSLAIPAFPASVEWWILLFLVLGFFWSSLAPGCFAASTVVLEGGMAGLSVGVLSFLLGISILLGPLLTGILITYVGWTWALASTGALMIVGIITTLTARIP